MARGKVFIGASETLPERRVRVSKFALPVPKPVYGVTSRIQGSIPGACSICGCRRATWISKLLCVKLLIGLGTLYKDQTGSASRHRKQDRHHYLTGSRAWQRSRRDTLNGWRNGAATQSSFVPGLNKVD